MLPFVSWSQGGKKTGPETEAERGMQNAAGSLQAQATITMSIYSAAGGRSYGRQGFPSSVLCTWYPESSAPQIFIFSLLDITRKHLTTRNRAQVFCKWKSPVLWKMQGFRTPAGAGEAEPLGMVLKTGFKAPPGQGGVVGKQKGRKLAPGTDNGHQGTESLSRKNSVRWSVSHQPAVPRSMPGVLS